MTADDLREDPVMQALAGLTAHGPDRERETRIRAVCHRQMSRRRRPTTRRVWATGPFMRRILEPALVTGVSIVYLFDVLRRAIQLYGF